ncbi:MAG: hypothetical protein PHI96_06235, partial [Desulfovibrio sp.]|nr:hypothetical protein [Desulfovibrio sp.]
AAPTQEFNNDLDVLLQSILTDQPDHVADSDAGHVADHGAIQTQTEPTASQEPAQAPAAAVDAEHGQTVADAANDPFTMPDPEPTASEDGNLTADLAADLEMLLASVNQTEPASAGDSAADQPAAADPEHNAEKLEFDLDALLAAADAEERGLQASTAAPQADAGQQPLEDILAAHAAAPAADQPQTAPPSFAADLDDALAGNVALTPDDLDRMLDQAGSAPAPVDLDKMLDQAGSALAATALAASAPSSVPAGSVPAGSADQISHQDMTALVQRLDQYAEQLQQADARVSALESAVADARAEAEQARNEADEARATALQAQAALDETLAATHSAHDSVAQTAAQALHTAQNAAQAVASAAAELQAGRPESTPSPEDLFTPDHPLHQRLLELIADAATTAAAEAAASAARQAADEAVQSAMQEARDNTQAEKKEDPVLLENLLDERLHAVNLSMRGTAARLDSVEERLDELEPRFNDRVEKAAAAAAARILREEIGRLLENE